MAAGLATSTERAFFGWFPKLHPVQIQAMEPIRSGADVIVLSRTGSGKTEAVLAPLVDRYLTVAREARGPVLLHIAPTRALANDLLRRLVRPMDELGLSVGIRHGERNDLSRAHQPSFLITTPESLDVMLSGQVPALRNLRAVIVDEIHLIYNTQRGFQLAVLLKRLEKFLGRALQVVGLSATIASATSIWSFLSPRRNVVTVHDPTRKLLDCHAVEANLEHDLVRILNRLSASAHSKILIFANSRRECDKLATAIREGNGFRDKVFVHHSSLDRDIRLEVEKRFLESRRAVCVATSTLELGIDIGDIDLVVLYGHPGGWEPFLQRVGRGSRRAEKSNVLYVATPDHGSTFVSLLSFESLVTQVQAGRYEREQPLEIYGAIVQQLLSVLLEQEGAFRSVAELLDLFSDWPYVDRPILEDVLSSLVNARLLRKHDFRNSFSADEELYRLRDLRLIWGNFPSRSRDLRVRTRNRDLGVIPSFNLLRIRPGSTIRFAGQYWDVREVRADSIKVEHSKRTTGVEVLYSGSKQSIDPTNLEEVLSFIESGVSIVTMSSDLRTRFNSSLERIRRHIDTGRIAVARDKDGYAYVTFAGQTVNEVIARWAGLTSYVAGDLLLRSATPVNFSSLPSTLKDLKVYAAQVMRLPENLTIFQSLLPPHLLERELVEIWLKTNVYQRSLDRLRSAQIASVAHSEIAELLV